MVIEQGTACTRGFGSVVSACTWDGDKNGGRSGLVVHGGGKEVTFAVNTSFHKHPTKMAAGDVQITEQARGSERDSVMATKIVEIQSG